MRGRRGALLALALGVAAFAPLSAQGRPAPSDVPDALVLAPVGAFSSPTYVTAPAGDQHRLFVVKQGGVIKLVIGGVIQTTPFLNASSWISSGGERGLLSMAFPPDYDNERVALHRVHRPERKRPRRRAAARRERLERG